MILKNISTDYFLNLSLELTKGECTILYDRESRGLKRLAEDLVGEGSRIHGEIFECKKGRRRLWDRCEWKYHIGLLSESPIQNHLYMERSYIDNLCLFLDNRKSTVRITSRIKRSIQKEYFTELGAAVYEMDIQNLNRTDMYNLVYYKVLLQHPDIVFITQPFAETDLSLRYHISGLIDKLLSHKIAVVILEFSPSDTFCFADRVVVLGNDVYKSEYFPRQSSASCTKL